MSRVFKSVTELVGHTPLIELVNFNKTHQGDNRG